MIRVLKKLFKLLNKRQRNRVFILLFMMLIGAVFEAFGISMMVPFVSAIMNPEIITDNSLCAWICETFHLADYVSFVVWCIVVLVILYMVKAAYLVFEYSVRNRFIFNARFLTQSKLLQSYIKRPYEYFLSAQSGEIIRIVQEDVRNSFNLLTAILEFATEAIVTAAIILTVFVIDPFMTIVASIVLLLLMVMIAKVFRPLLRREGRIYKEAYAATNKWLLQAISGIKEVKVTQTEDFFLANFLKYGRKQVRAARLEKLLGSIPRNLIETVSISSVMIVIGVMISTGYEMETLIPSMSAFVMAAIKLLPSANHMVGVFSQINFFEPSLDSMLVNLDVLEEKVVVATKEVEKMPLTKEIRLSGITYSYPGGEKKIFDCADLSIPVGCSIGIVGTSGAGKTTAVDIMLCLLNPQEGQVLADSVDVSTNIPGWLAHIGYIPQMIFMLDDTIRENVVFGHAKEQHTDDDVWTALEEAQLADFVRELPAGLDTTIGERGIRLSGGQRQRIGIARALFTNPEVLVFDEATSALDNETEEAIMQSIYALHGKKTMIIIAHRLTTIEGCDMVYRVADGKFLSEKG